MPSRIRVVLGRNVCRLRNRRDMSQEELAAKLETNRRYVQRIESGEANVGPLLIALPLPSAPAIRLWRQHSLGQPTG